jgi:hypothetical protein
MITEIVYVKQTYFRAPSDWHGCCAGDDVYWALGSESRSERCMVSVAVTGLDCSLSSQQQTSRRAGNNFGAFGEAQGKKQETLTSISMNEKFGSICRLSMGAMAVLMQLCLQPK